jgi:hypothetical protein
VKTRNPYKLLVGKSKGRDHMGELELDREILLKLIIYKHGMRVSADSFVSEQVPLVDSCE